MPFKTFPMDVEFDLDHHASCTYKQTELDKAGKFECDDGTKVVCSDVDNFAINDPMGPNFCSPDGMHVFRNQAVCSIGDPDSAQPAVRPYREYYPGYYLNCLSEERCDYDFQILYNDQGLDPLNNDDVVNFPCRSKVVSRDAWRLEEGLFPYNTGVFPAVEDTDNSPLCDYHQDEPTKAGYFNCFGGLLIDCVDYDPGLQDCPLREVGDPRWRFVAKCVVSNPDGDKFDFSN